MNSSAIVPKPDARATGYVLLDRICDAVSQCGDWSDEKGCTSCPKPWPFKCDCYEIGCPGRIRTCVENASVCDGRNACGDWSDELGCSCPANKPIKCDCYETGCPITGSVRSACIQTLERCDGTNHCGDWSDETDCLGINLFCSDGQCVDRLKVNDGFIDMKNGVDEFACCHSCKHQVFNCMEHNDICATSRKCIPGKWIGDGIPDCCDKSDEPCQASLWRCDGCQILVNRCTSTVGKNLLLSSPHHNITTCHKMNKTLTRSSNFSFEWVCITSPCGTCIDMYQCENGQVIESKYFCDKKVHCDDGSDEANQPFGFRCSGKSRKGRCVLSQSNILDSTAQCADGSDLCYLNGQFRCFVCLDEKLVISAKQVCDGKIDCYDVSDECFCSNQSLCDELLGVGDSRCPFSTIHCNSSIECIDSDNILCKQDVLCANNINQTFCNFAHKTNNLMECMASDDSDRRRTIRATRCDGRPECGNLKDECSCDNPPDFCQSPCANWVKYDLPYGSLFCDGKINGRAFSRDSCSKSVEENCPKRFYCENNGLISIDKKGLCDGIIDCDDSSDENKENCGDKRFYCTNQNPISVSKSFICDGIKDCDKGEDEAKNVCEKTRFYCVDGDPISVQKSFVENGIKDCSDGNDERKTLFSNRYEMIANTFLRYLFWFMGFLTLFGNSAVAIDTAKSLRRQNFNAVGVSKRF